MKFYLVSVKGKRCYWNDDEKRYIDDRIYQSFGPAIHQTFPAILDEASRLAEKIHKAVRIYSKDEWNTNRVPRHPVNELPMLNRFDYQYIEDEEHIQPCYGTFGDIRDNLYEFIAKKNIPIEFIINGNPDHDDDYLTMFEYMRNNMVVENKLDRDFVCGVTNYSRWEYANRWKNMSPMDIFKEIIDTPCSAFSFTRLMKTHKWINNGTAYREGPFAEKIQIVASRYGYGLYICWDKASKRKRTWKGTK